MTRLRGSIIAAAAVPLLLLSACAQPAADGAGSSPSGAPESSAPAATGGANDLVVRSESYGGFVPADRTVGNLPAVSVYADGRVITNGPVPAIYPGAALPNVQVQQVSPELVQTLVTQGQAAGVKTGTDFGQPGVADAPTTRITLVVNGTPQTVAVEALREGRPDDPKLTAPQREARTKLSDFVKKLESLPGQTGMGSSVAYAPEAVAVLARPWTDPGAEVQSPAKAWPGPALPGTYLNPSFKIGCVVVTGAEKDKVLAAAKDATQITPWTAGSDKYLITFRPLLPDEEGCAVLKGNRG